MSDKTEWRELYYGPLGYRVRWRFGGFNDDGQPWGIVLERYESRVGEWLPINAHNVRDGFALGLMAGSLATGGTMFDDPPTDEQGRPTHYSVHEHGAVGRPHRVTCDGKKIKYVREVDVCNGWARALCLYDHTGYGGEPHLDPESPDEPCEVVFTGDVRFEWLDE